MNKKKTPEVQANPTQRSTENMQQPAMKTHTHHAESLTTRNQGHKIG
jgi:hypothetical protein